MILKRFIQCFICNSKCVDDKEKLELDAEKTIEKYLDELAVKTYDEIRKK